MEMVTWPIKQEVLRILTGTASDEDVIRKILNASDERGKYYLDDKRWPNLIDHYTTRWKRPGKTIPPKSPYQLFFVLVSEYLDLNECMPGRTLIVGNIDDFLSALPTEGMDRLRLALDAKGAVTAPFLEPLREALARVTHPHASDISGAYPETPYHISVVDGDEQEYFPIWTRSSLHSLPLAQQGLAAKYIDQSLYYQRPESVKLWFKVTEDPLYKVAEQCETGIKRLIRDPRWRAYLSRQDFSGVVTLGGGGAPKKDLDLLYSLTMALRDAQHKRSRATYTILDASFFMICASRTELHSRLKNTTVVFDSIKLQAIMEDMLNLGKIDPLVRPDAGNLIWLISGNTFGNVNEERFFDSIETSAKVGDWLILGVGCVPDMATPESVAELEEEYERDVVKALIGVPFGTLMLALERPIGSQYVMEHMRTRAVVGEKNTYSVIPGTTSVIASVPIDGIGDVILFKSSRYTSTGLIDFAKQRAWNHVFSVNGIDNAYRQMVFEYAGHE